MNELQKYAAAVDRVQIIATAKRNHFLGSLSVKYPMRRPEKALTIMTEVALIN